jgi:hypothetical protein
MTRCSLWLWTPQAGPNQVPQSSLTPQYRGQERGGEGCFGQGWALAKEVQIPVGGNEGSSRNTDAKEYPKLYFNLQIKGTNLELRISPRIFEKFETAIMVYSGAWGKLIHERKQKWKIS